jgi:hypothetical protein
MDRGTEVYFCWDLPRTGLAILEKASEVASEYSQIAQNGDWSWHHELFGGFFFTWFRPPATEMDCVALTFADCDLLPEFNEDDLDAQAACRAAYNYIKKLFVVLDADLCVGTTLMDGVAPFDFDNPDISRVLRFTRAGPQRGVRPYEEDRLITLHGDLADIGRDPRTGEPNWVMRFEGPLTIPG